MTTLGASGAFFDASSCERKSHWIDSGSVIVRRMPFPSAATRLNASRTAGS